MKKTIQRTVCDNLDEKFLVEASGDDRISVALKVYHKKPGMSSNVSILVLASGQAKVTVDATAVIEESAPGTNAWLEIRVVSRDSAVVKASPNLEIRNNDVKAGHALKTKHISDEELFYLMSRGLSRAQSEQLVIKALSAPYQGSKIRL